MKHLDSTIKKLNITDHSLNMPNKDKIRSISSEYKSIQLLKRQKIHFGVFLEIKKIMKFKSIQPKIKYFDLLNLFFVDRLDVIYYLRHLNKFEKIINCIFNSQLISAFDYIRVTNLKNRDDNNY
jgi:hypothetical protein